MILGMEAWVFWLVLSLVLIVIEALTVNLLTIWFVGGTLAAMIASFLGASVTLQVIIAFAISAVLLALVIIFKPFDKFRKKENLPTNSDRVIGQTGMVLEGVDSIEGTGLVKVMGQTWSAVSGDGSYISAGSEVLVKAISGVKLIVDKK